MLTALVIDDSLTMRKMLSNMFEDMKIEVVATAKDGEEGINLYEEHKPSFVTMDINMPGMSGIEALKVIRDKHKDANVFMLTSRGDNQSVVEAIKYGAKGYILKPLNKEKIEDAIVNIFPNAFSEDSINDENLGIQNYETAIKDTLTDLYTIQYMHTTMEHLIEMHNRHEEFSIGLLILNINNLELILNDEGSMKRDIILTQVADIVRDTVRTEDFPIRLTNNEFAIFILGTHVNNMDVVAKKLKSSVEAISDTKLDVSVGLAVHKQKEKLIQFIERADEAVIKATESENKIFMIE